MLLSVPLDAQIVATFDPVDNDASVFTPAGLGSSDLESFLTYIPNSNEDTEFRAKQLILPASLILAGSLYSIPAVRDLNIDIRDNVLEWKGTHTTNIDDYLQVVPHLSYFGLSLVGLEAKHNYLDRTLVMATSSIAVLALSQGVKIVFREERPDGSNNHSFPSGHTARVFMGAELIRMEYGENYPLVGIGAYTLATGISALRLYNNKHWLTDVVAGAGLGILCAKIGCWLLPYTRELAHRITGLDAFIYPVVGDNTAAIGVSMSF